MGTIINTNVQALNSQRSLKVVSETGAKAAEKLASGQRINHAGDDAAGLAISEKMRNQIKGLNQASRNAQDGISMVQTAEGALQETHEMLKRMRELVVQASNDTNVSLDRGKIATEIRNLLSEVDSTAGKTEFNTKKLIDGSQSASNSLFLQVGANANDPASVFKGVSANVSTYSASAANVDGQRLQFSISSMNTSGLGLRSNKGTTGGAGASPSKAEYSLVSAVMVQKNGIAAADSKVYKANGTTVQVSAGQTAFSKMSGSQISVYIKDLDKAIANVSEQRANLGAIQNRLEHTIKNLDTSSENLSASESRIRDTDMAQEMMNFTKANVLQQAATSMLAQANQAPNNVLSLLR